MYDGFVARGGYTRCKSVGIVDDAPTRIRHSQHHGRRNEADDRHDDHQFDKRETGLRGVIRVRWNGYPHSHDTRPDRKSVVSGKSVHVRVDLGGRRDLNTTIAISSTTTPHTTYQL